MYFKTTPGTSRSDQLSRLKNVIRSELTPCQREVVLAYYIQGLPLTAIAKNRGVHRSTVLRTLRRAETRLKRCLKY